jgi:pimeloyl-ACP methyl ester carboxylesterase
MTAEDMKLNHVRRGSGEPLLLIHSLGGTLSQWNPVMELLAAHRDVIAIDMPGFGRSPLLPNEVEPTARNLASAVIEFSESLGLRSRPGVAGISLGSWVAIECGRLGGASAVVALSPAGFWRSPLGARPNTAHDLAKRIRPLVPLLMRNEELRHRALATNVHNPERVPLQDAIDLIQGYGGAEGYVEANRLMRTNTIGDLTDLDVPLLIAWAEFDRLVRNRPLPPGLLPPGVRQTVLPGCGHVPTWDDPELVASVILEGTSAGTASAAAAAGTGDTGE